MPVKRGHVALMRFVASHWSAKMTANMAVMMKSSPEVSKVMRPPRRPPSVAPATQDELVEEADEEVEPASVDAFGRNDSAVVDGESLITQGEDEIRFFHPHVLEPAKHGNAVEQMPCA